MQDLDDVERRLLVAVILRAAKDAKRGSGPALAWLLGDGAALACDLHVCHPDAVREWSATLRPQRAVGGPEKLAVLMAEQPGITRAEAAVALGVKQISVKRYYFELKARGDLGG